MALLRFPPKPSIFRLQIVVHEHSEGNDCCSVNRKFGSEIFRNVKNCTLRQADNSAILKFLVLHHRSQRKEMERQLSDFISCFFLFLFRAFFVIPLPRRTTRRLDHQTVGWRTMTIYRAVKVICILTGHIRCSTRIDMLQTVFRSGANCIRHRPYSLFGNCCLFSVFLLPDGDHLNRSLLWGGGGCGWPWACGGGGGWLG